MSTTAITPGGGAAPAAGSAAPPSAPAAPSTTAAPSVPAAGGSETSGGDGGGTSAPAAPAAELSTRERLEQGWQKAVAEVEKQQSGVAVEEPDTETPEVGEGAGTGEEEEGGETEAAAAGEETEETPAGEETQGQGETVETPELDDGEAYGPKAFTDFLRENPEALKALDAHPEIKNKVMGALRRDEDNRALRQIIPDVETAKSVTGAAATFQNFDNRFLASTTPEGAQNFLEYWVREAMITDDKGQPVMSADGKYQFHPALSYTFEHIFNNKLSTLKEQAGKSGNERLQAALDVLTEELSPDSAAQSDMPEELRPQAEALAEERRKFNAEKEERNRELLQQQQVANQQSIDRAEGKAAESVVNLLKPSFAKASLSEFEQNAALEKIGALVDAALENNPLYQAMYDSIIQREPGEAREKALTAHMLKFTNEILGGIAAKVIREAKGGALTRQTAKQNQVDAQKRDSKVDPKATSVGGARTAATNDPKQVIAQITKEYQAAHNGEMPDRDYLIRESMKRSGTFAPKK